MCVKQSIKQGPQHSLSPQSITEVWEEQSEWEAAGLWSKSDNTILQRDYNYSQRWGEAVGGFREGEGGREERVKGINWINVRET